MDSLSNPRFSKNSLYWADISQYEVKNWVSWFPESFFHIESDQCKERESESRSKQLHVAIYVLLNLFFFSLLLVTIHHGFALFVDHRNVSFYFMLCVVAAVIFKEIGYFFRNPSSCFTNQGFTF